MPRIPDLVSDSKLETFLRPDGKFHTYSEVTHGRQRISWQERWNREKVLGEGGFGRVWLEACTQGKSQGSLRAVKTMPKKRNASYAIDYNRELEAIAKFSHRKYEACFVKSFGWYESTEIIYIAMEYLPDGDLHTYLQDIRSKLSPEEAGQVTLQILEGLHFMHTNGFAHRDIKPGNISIKSRPPQNWWIKLADFGISKRAEDGNGPSTIKGTPGFMAPELRGFGQQYRGDGSVDFQAADMWALGEVTFRMLTGDLGQVICPSAKLLPSAGENAANFVTRLLDVALQARIKASDALNHPWMRPFRNKAGGTSLPASIPSDTSVRFDQTTIQSEAPSARWSAVFEIGYGNSATGPVSETPAPVFNSYGEKRRQSTKTDHILNHGHPQHIPKAPEQSRQGRFDTDAEIVTDRSVSIPNTLATLRSAPASTERQKRQVNPDRGLSHRYSFDKIASTESKREWTAWLTLERRHPSCSGLPSEGHNSAVLDVAFSPNGKTLASASYKTVTMWDGKTGAALQTLEGHESHVNLVAFSPDGKTLASASWDKTIRLWDIRTGAALQILEGHEGGVRDVAFSPDGKTLTLALNSRDNTVVLCDSRSGGKLHRFEGHSDRVTGVAFSPDSKTLASASWDKTIRLWDIRTGAALQILEGHEGGVRGVAFSPDGKMLASASYDRTIVLWEVGVWDGRLGAALQRLQGHNEAVAAVVFSPDGTTLASGSSDTTVRLWKQS
ncbi:MAG: hypothetical protein M1821_008388 [Bathelium mastoideum]|nr:MAG: hypothetical protein M1821_008388 [Bathelium mastoideum]